MCGILCLLNESCYKDTKSVNNAIEEGRARGPEQTRIHRDADRIFVFHRLAINGLDSESMQPIRINNITLICNGEIFNYKTLYSALGETGTSDSDCEIIIHLYLKFGIERTLELLDGEFAFILHDSQETEDIIYYARDPFGVRPLYKCFHPESGVIGIASELKVLNHIADGKMDIKQVDPGTYSKLIKSKSIINSSWTYNVKNTRYFRLPSIDPFKINDKITPNTFFQAIVNTLSDAVKKRVETAERDVACLLSGGLDSSLIAALACKHYGKLNTYSIGMKGSEDLRNARIVADHIGSNHREIILSQDEFFNSIPEVVRAIESFDTTTVRASVGNYLVAKHIRNHSDDKVVLNGDGSDEVAGGYIYIVTISFRS